MFPLFPKKESLGEAANEPLVLQRDTLSAAAARAAPWALRVALPEVLTPHLQRIAFGHISLLSTSAVPGRQPAASVTSSPHKTRCRYSSPVPAR